MFGYIIVHKPELKVREYETYKASYCGLCRSLKKRHGRIGQMTLSYDMTFLALYKCLDDWQDEKKLWARIFSWMLVPKMKKIRKLYGEKAQMTADNLKALRELEKKNICDIDKSAGFFGRIMAELFVCREDEWAEKLRKMGFYFGKFIYLMDAYEDIEEDLKQNRYNPLAELYGQESFEENCQQILKMMMAETSRVFEQLPIVEEVEILRNILYAGVWSRYGQIRCSRKGTDKKE